MKRYLLPIIVSVVALVTIAAVSYAYFTATIDPSGETTATIRTATVGTVTFVTESPTSNLTDVLPGWEGQGSTTVYFNNNSDDDVAYHCTVQLESGSYATNVYIQTLSGSDAQVENETALTEQGVIVSQGTLEAQSNITSPNHGDEHVVTYKIIFKEIGQAQNDDQGRTINTYTTCVIDQQAGSALNLLSGTMLDSNNEPIANQAMVIFSSPTYFTTDAQGHYEVRVSSGSHNIYYIPGYTMEQTVAAGTGIQSNENVVTKSITVAGNNTSSNIAFEPSTYTVSVTCNNCTADENEKIVEAGGNITFDITKNSGYTLTGATVTGGCTLSNGVLTASSVADDMECSVTAVASQDYVYWSTPEGGEFTEYSSSSIPSTVHPSHEAISESPSYAFIRTTVYGDTVQGHEACVYYGGNVFCLGPNYWVNGDEIEDEFQGVGYQTKEKIRLAMESALHISDFSCGSGGSSSNAGAQCVYYDEANRSFSCNSNYPDNASTCGSSYNYWCSVEPSGTAYCGNQ